MSRMRGSKKGFPTAPRPPAADELLSTGCFYRCCFLSISPREGSPPSQAGVELECHTASYDCTVGVTLFQGALRRE